MQVVKEHEAMAAIIPFIPDIIQKIGNQRTDDIQKRDNFTRDMSQRVFEQGNGT
jgi:hypothetical protein